MAAPSIGGTRRIVALLFLSLLVLAPLVWIAWSLHAASLAAESIRTQSETLAALGARLSVLRADAGSGEAAAASVFLPGETPAVAGAALQRLVATTVEAAGGRVTESEIAPGESPEDPGRVDLRVSFDTEIVGLQKILFDLETGSPILLIRDLSVQTSRETADIEGSSPPLRVVAVVGGYWEAEK
jgi:hypothetical protein